MNYIWLILVLFILFDLLVLFFVVFFRKRKKYNDKDLNFIKMNWFRILDLSSSDLSKAVLDADKLLDFALSKKGKAGSLGEKLKSSKTLFTNIDAVWGAHKLRNKVAHELKKVDEKELRNAISVYKKALQDLGVKL